MTLHPLLEIETTKVCYFGISGKCWHLAGVGAGAEGVALGDSPSGHMFAPTSILVSEGARQDGADFLRSVRSKKEIDFIVDIGGDTLPLLLTRPRHWYAVHDSWFRDWSTDKPGTLAFWTRYQGWRYQQVRLDSAPAPVTGIDPALNLHEAYQMGIVALDPLEHHMPEPSVWVNADGFGEGVVVGRNAADQPAWPRYVMNGPGRFHIGDLGGGDTPRIVETPPILEGETLRIDTHPRHRTARVYSDALPSGRNVWGALAGRRWFKSIDPWSSVSIPVRVTDGGSTESTVRLDVDPRSSRPF
ncbi:phage tail family protein [Nocardia cyriacigeorgica]|uniref:phage tail family protein n=1 Tax=Nocardia cyriacigeorgica TaxID=135487 RepID=UPI0021152D87|nr:phage tail family protein [Nocardia cyriacigeorgica]